MRMPRLRSRLGCGVQFGFLLRIFVSDRSHPQIYQIPEHPDRIARESHFARGTVVPADRNLDDLAAQSLDQEQQFGVKAESLDALQLERAACRVPPCETA